MNWGDLGVGIALVLIIEGLLPFLSPSRYRSMLKIAAGIADSRLRIGGTMFMILGLIILYLVN